MLRKLFRSMERKQPSQEEERKQLILRHMRAMLERLSSYEADTLVTGGEKFLFPGTENHVGFELAVSSKSAGQLMLNTFARREEPLYGVRHYAVASGTLADIRAYLTDESHAAALLDSLHALSDNVDAAMLLDKEQLLEAKRRNITNACVKTMLEMARADMPETGPFKRMVVEGEYPGTGNVVGISIEPDRLNPAQARMNTFAYRDGTDMVINHFGQSQPREAILAALDGESYIAEVLESFRQLSDSVDDKW